MANHIDLKHIGASRLAFILAQPHRSASDLVELLRQEIANDLQLARHYIDKYDDARSLAEGTNVESLKAEIAAIEASLKMLAGE